MAKAKVYWETTHARCNGASHRAPHDIPNALQGIQFQPRAGGPRTTKFSKQGNSRQEGHAARWISEPHRGKGSRNGPHQEIGRVINSSSHRPVFCVADDLFGAGRLSAILPRQHSWDMQCNLQGAPSPAAKGGRTSLNTLRTCADILEDVCHRDRTMQALRASGADWVGLRGARA